MFFECFWLLDKAKPDLKNEYKLADKYPKPLWTIAGEIYHKGGTVKDSRYELELIHRSQAGDTEAFGELVTKYRTKIFNMIYQNIAP